MSDCKGYSNYPTWDVLYWSMDEISYRDWPYHLNGMVFTVETVRPFVHDLLGDVTYHGVHLDDESVNWDEIARAWTTIFHPSNKEE